MINDWLKIPYLDHGRDSEGSDCWGLVRLVRHNIRGDLLPSYGAISPDSKKELTLAAMQVMNTGFALRDKPIPGSIATIWRWALCIHVGIVVEADGLLAVLETNRKTGVRWMRLADFENSYIGVKYYDND